MGYAVVPQARDALCSLYARTLTLLQGLPRDSAYHRNAQQVVQQRLQIVQAETCLETIEEKIGCGQVEELIDQVCSKMHGAMVVMATPTWRFSQAKRELSLTNRMEEWKPWQTLISEAPPDQWKWP